MGWEWALLGLALLAVLAMCVFLAGLRDGLGTFLLLMLCASPGALAIIGGMDAEAAAGVNVVVLGVGWFLWWMATSLFGWVRSRRAERD